MSLACPRPCGRLATGAIFISLAVVQLIAAVILLKSKYVYLLSVPNIWTAVSNIAVGGLLGVSAGVWKKTSKRSSKHAVRRNILTALVTSAIIMNTTTAVLLIMGNGNTLLSIHLENKGIDNSATLASEMLAYAYAASICMPILCVVVALIFLLVTCFPKRKNSSDKRSVFGSGSSTFNWVYKTEHRGLPIPDPEIVKKALSSKSFTSSDDSSSSSEFDIRADSMHDLHTLKKGIYRIKNQHGSTFPQTIRHHTESTENYADTISRCGNQVSFIDDPSVVSDRTIPKRVIQTELERGSVELCSPPKLKTKKRGDLYALIYDTPRNEEWQRLEGILRKPHPQDTSVTVADTSVASERNNRMSPKPYTVSEEPEYSSPDESFGKSLHGFGHEHLRRTSTTASLNHMIEMLDRENSQSDILLKSPVKSLNRTLVQKTISGESFNSLVRNSNSDLLDQTDGNIDSRAESLFGEVVPIRVNTVPRKKLPAKLIPVSIPDVPSIKNEYLPKRKECKFDAARREGFSSFHVGHQMKIRSKGTGSHSAKLSEPTFAVTTPKVPVSEVPAEEANLQLSPAHTSGYISALEDTVEISNQDPSTSNKATTSNSSTYAGRGSGTSVSVRKKFRAAQRKILDGGRPLLETDAINDIVMQMISENQFSNKESINKLFYDLLLQKVAHQSVKDDY